MGHRNRKQLSGTFIIIFAFIWAIFFDESFAQWQKIPDLEYTNIYCMLTSGDSIIFVGGDYGTLLRSSDNGSTWTSVMGNGFWVDTVLSLGQGLGYIFAGANGAGSIYRSSDQGLNWNPANSGFLQSAQVTGFTFVDTKLFAATNCGVYSSVDSGGSWNIDTSGLGLNQSYPGDGNGLAGITSSGSKLYTIKWQGGYVYSKSADSISWQQISSEYLNIGLAITSIDTNIFIAAQKGIYLYEGGTTWLPKNNGLSISDTSWIAQCIFARSGSSLFAKISTSSIYTSGIYVTNDLGENWTKLNDNVFSGSSINAVTANNKYIFVSAGYNSWRMLIEGVVPVELTSFTANAAAAKITLSWKTSTEVNNYGFEIQRSNDNNKFVPVGFIKGSGTTTKPQTYSYVDNISGNFYYRLKQVDFNGAFKYSNVVEAATLPENFQLEQNYPNPFNPTTKIKFIIPKLSFVNLTVYDMLGKEVAALVNEEKNPGSYEVQLDGSKLSSGIYFYVLNIGDKRLSKKMCLLK